MQHQVAPQDDVFGLMADPATHGGAAVKRLDTHAAAVFLAGERAYKVKRAVRFPFLDYGTPEKRKAACEAELAVNAPFAAALYRRVAAITREGDGRLALDGAGTPVEWAVEMRRFDEDRTLDRLADAGRIDLALADALARAVAAAHAQAPAVAVEPWLQALAAFLDQNDAAFAETPELFPAADVEALGRAARAALARNRALLLARGRQGLVRRGHGDLHLGNIALIDGKPVPFDAIEFDPIVAAGDVLYDLGFLLMDLVERGLGDAANVVLNRYLVETRREVDLDALAALPLFLSLRAAIRSKVTAARRGGAQGDERRTVAAVAVAYFRLACDLIAPPPPRLVAIGGLSGTGKSALARALAPSLMPAPGAIVVRSDVERKLMLGVAETERLPVSAYAPDTTARVYASVVAKASRIVAAGHSAIVDAVFSTPEERAAAAVPGPRFDGIFLVADLETRIARVGRRAADASDADAEIARIQEGYALGEIAWHRIDASGTPEQTLANAKRVLSCQ